MMAACPLCERTSRLRFPESIRREEMNAFTYASRKRPELMHYAYYECTDCRHLFSIDDVDLPELFGNYRDADYDSAVEASFAARTYARAVSATIGRTSGSLLDVGCGDGAFLKEARRTGIAGHVVGVEPSVAAVNASDPDIRANILVGPLEQIEVSSQFDLVTFFQTIEHVRDPIAFLTRLRSLVAPGGHLVIIGHDWTSTVNRILGTSSPIFDIEHLQIFSRNSMRIALERVGASGISVRPVWNTYPLSYWVKIAPAPLSLLPRLLPQRLSSRLPISLPVGNLVSVASFD